MKQGLIYVFTGEGKGKTSAALGVATRSLLLDKKVVWISFYKEESWGMAEKGLRDKFPNLSMEFVGKGFKINKPINQLTNEKIKIAKVGNKGNVVVDKASEEEHREAVEKGLRLMARSLKEKPFLLVADEILNTVSEGLVDEQEVMKVIEERGESHVVLTGRGASGGVVEVADLVTECKKVKHPYDRGELAVQGLDF